MLHGFSEKGRRAKGDERRAMGEGRRVMGEGRRVMGFHFVVHIYHIRTSCIIGKRLCLFDLDALFPISYL